MANKTIPDLQLISAVTDGVQVPVDNSLQTYRATALQFKNYILAASTITTAMLQALSVTFAKLSAQVVNDATTVTGLAADYVLIADASDSGNVKKALISDINDYANRGLGECVQVVNLMTGASTTGNTALPIDDSIPQSGEGTEFMTLAITPKSTTNILVIEVVWLGATTVTGHIGVALFQDAVAGALAAAAMGTAGSGSMLDIPLRHKMLAGTTSSTTFKVRVGTTAGNLVTFNGAGAARLFGGVMASSITIREYKA